VDELRHDIMTGALRQGQRIDQDAWAERVGASRTPVRSALERLETEGFVKLSGRRGANIIELTITDIEDVLSTRLILDAALGRTAALDLDKATLDELRSILEQINAVKLPDDHAQMVEPTQRFHARLFQAAGASMMYRLENQSVQHTNVFLSNMWFRNRQIAYVGKAYFTELYKACEAHDPDRVEHLIREYRIDMAGVILQDRIRTEELRILPGVLTPAELRRLAKIVDDGQDPTGPSVEAMKATDANSSRVPVGQTA
jgi:DNA-binding GntR family transcriptional regulator